MPVTPTLPNNESNSAGVGANIPDNVNVLFSGRYATTVSNYYDNLITWLENSPNKNRFAIVSLDNSNSEIKHYLLNLPHGDINIEVIPVRMPLG